MVIRVIMPTPFADQACSAATALSLVVEDAAEPVLVAVPVAVPLDEESAFEPLPTSAESLSSSVKAAFTEVAFLQSLGGSALPLTKLAAMHFDFC
jgi:hypothetical protein